MHKALSILVLLGILFLPLGGHSQDTYYTNKGQKIIIGQDPYGCFQGNTEKAGELAYSYAGLSSYKFIFKELVVCSNTAATPAKSLYITNLSSGQTKSYDLEVDSIRVITNVYNPCIVLPEPPCYTAYYSHVVVDLPPLLDQYHWGYAAVVEYCCRDTYKNIFAEGNVIYNISNPFPGSDPPLTCGGTNSGTVYNGIANYVKVPPLWAFADTCCFTNGSPLFQEDTILYLCKGQQFSHRFHAIDPDKDSLSYGFIASKTFEVVPTGGGNLGISRQFPFPDVWYYTPKYTAGEPLGPGVEIESKTGIMHGVMNDTGSFILTVAAYEYRKFHGQDSLIGVHYKDVIIKVFDCEKLPKPKAILPALLNECNDYTIRFPNTSIPLFSNYKYNAAFFPGNLEMEIQPKRSTRCTHIEIPASII